MLLEQDAELAFSLNKTLYLAMNPALIQSNCVVPNPFNLWDFFPPYHSWLLNPNAAATHTSPAGRIKRPLVRVQAAFASSQWTQQLWRKLMRAEHPRNGRGRGMLRMGNFKDMPEICWKHWNIFTSSWQINPMLPSKVRQLNLKPSNQGQCRNPESGPPRRNTRIILKETLSSATALPRRLTSQT